MDQKVEPVAMQPKDAARFIGLSRSRLYELIASGEIEARKVGARTIIPTASLRAFVAAAPLKSAA
jgi:excisionase family DNA binding protein